MTLVFNNILQFWNKRKNEARLKQTFLILLFISSIILAQEKSEVELTGRLNQDFQISYNHTNKFMEDSVNVILDKRSPILAGGLSLILPGAGQFYNEDYWKTAIFILVEAAAITTIIVSNNKGDEQKKFKKISHKSLLVQKFLIVTYGLLLSLSPIFIYSHNGPLIPNRRNFFCSSVSMLMLRPGNIQVGFSVENCLIKGKISFSMACER